MKLKTIEELQQMAESKALRNKRIKLSVSSLEEACEMLEEMDAETLAALHLPTEFEVQSHLKSISLTVDFVEAPISIRYLNACKVPHYDVFELPIDKEGNRILESMLETVGDNGMRNLVPSESFLEVLSYVIRNTDDIDKKSGEHPTALQIAIMHANFPAAKLLLEAGASPDIAYKEYENCDELAKVNVTRSVVRGHFYKEYAAYRAEMQLSSEPAQSKRKVSL